jgi:hypothetical protein
LSRKGLRRYGRSKAGKQRNHGSGTGNRDLLNLQYFYYQIHDDFLTQLGKTSFRRFDFSPKIESPEGTFTTITEKLVLELTVKVLQLQQVTLAGSVAVVPLLTGLTPPPTP